MGFPVALRAATFLDHVALGISVLAALTGGREYSELEPFYLATWQSVGQVVGLSLLVTPTSERASGRARKRRVPDSTRGRLTRQAPFESLRGFGEVYSASQIPDHYWVTRHDTPARV